MTTANLPSWSVQVAVVIAAGIGAAQTARWRHPHSRLRFFRLLLARTLARTAMAAAVAVGRTAFRARRAGRRAGRRASGSGAGGNVMAGHINHQVAAVYPPLAKQARIQGIVRFDVAVGKDGSVRNLMRVAGHPLPVSAAQEAVSQWKYQPVMLNGQAVAGLTVVDVNFTLSEYATAS